MRTRTKLLTPADLKALERLMRVALRGCRTSMGCPRCGGEGTRLLVALNPGVVVECPECGEVWKEGE